MLLTSYFSNFHKTITGNKMFYNVRYSKGILYNINLIKTLEFWVLSFYMWYTFKNYTTLKMIRTDNTFSQYNPTLLLSRQFLKANLRE